jgi:hypothetical protein
MKFYAVLSFQLFRQARVIVFQQSIFSVNRMLYQYFTVLKSTLSLPLSLQVRVLLFRLLCSVSFLWLLHNRPWIPSIISHPSFTPHNAIPCNILDSRIFSYIFSSTLAFILGIFIKRVSVARNACLLFLYSPPPPQPPAPFRPTF